MFLAIFAVAVFVTITTQATLIPPEIVEFKSVNSNKLNLDEPNDVVSYGKGFKLVCKAKGSKPLKFQWKKDGVPIEQVHIWKNIRPVGSNGQTLQVKNPDPSADGKYQCFVSNAAGATFTRKMRVKVTYTSSFKESYKTVSKVNATLGRPLRLTCPSHSDGGQGNFGVNHFWVRKKLPYIKYLRPKQHRVILPNGDFLFLYLDQADIDEIKLFPDKTVQCAVNAGRFIDYSKQYLIEATKTETDDFGPEFKSPDHYPKSQEQAILLKRKEMFCVAVGKPAPKITWYRRKQDGQMTILKKINNGKEGFQLESFGRKLVINQVSKANEGYYQCTADNGVGKTVLPPPTKLNVAVAPKWISKPAKEVSVPINGQKSLMCEAVGTPPLTYNWYYNGTAFKSPDERKPHIVVQGNILKFTDMQQSNEGVFQCSVENDWGMVVSSSLVKAVKGSLTPPQIIQFSPFNSNKPNLDEAGDVINTEYGFKIVCKSSGSKPLKFQWKKDGINIENTQRIIYSKKAIDDNGEMLHVKYPDPSADGKYQCFVSNAAGATFTRKMRVKVTYATDFKEDENVVTKLKATVGKSLRLICPPHSDGRHGLFGAQHFWARKQRSRVSILSPSKNRVKLPNGDFLFLHLSQDDIDEIKLFPDKTVQCAVNAGRFIDYSKQYLIEATKTVTTDFGPEFQTPHDYPRSIEYAIHGRSKKMLCAAAGKPEPNITWYRLNDDKTILKKIEHGKDGFVLQDYGRQLVINQASISQHEIGYYQCEASNGAGPSVKTPPTKLQVVAAPKWTTMPAKEVSVPINGKKTLLCEAVGTPPLTYNWYYNGTAFKSPDERKPHVVVQGIGNILKITDMQQDNEGVFQCAVENAWGTLVSETWVKVN